MLQTIYIILYKNITPVYHEIDRNQYTKSKVIIFRNFFALNILNIFA